MGWLKEFQSEEDYLDALWTAHQDGECQEFVKYGECKFCVDEREKRQWEEKLEDDKRAQACADAFKPLANKCEFWCASLHKPHIGPCFELYSHDDTCPGKPDCVHDEEEEWSACWTTT